MHGEHIKLVVASLAFSNTGIGCNHPDIACDVGEALPDDPVATALAGSKPPYADEDRYDIWGDAVAARQIDLSKRAIQLAKELDATMRSYTALDHAGFNPGGSWQGGLFGPDDADCGASGPTTCEVGRIRLSRRPITAVC